MKPIPEELKQQENLCNDAIASRQETLKAVLHYFYHDNTRSGSHSRYNIKYHIVWIPKYRKKLLTEDMGIRLKQIFMDIAEEYQLKVIATEVMPDHIHLLIDAPPKYAPATLIAIIKQKSSSILRSEFRDHIKKYIYKKATLWATGYYVATLADKVTTGIVKEYINNQKSNDNNCNDKQTGKQLPLFPT
jgi:putative transposase